MGMEEEKRFFTNNDFLVIGKFAQPPSNSDKLSSTYYLFMILYGHNMPLNEKLYPSPWYFIFLEMVSSLNSTHTLPLFFFFFLLFTSSHDESINLAPSLLRFLLVDAQKKTSTVLTGKKMGRELVVLEEYHPLLLHFRSLYSHWW